MIDMKCKAYYKPLKIMLEPEQIESINLEMKFLGVYMVMDGRGYHKIRMSDFEIMWYTGLQDSNGKEIFEGDIVKTVALLNDHSQKGAIDIVVVRNYQGNFCLCFNGYESGTPIYPLNVSHKIEVIGNIYENPELLEVESNE